MTVWRILQGDARTLPLPDRAVDAIVTDPPYGLHFMGKTWDNIQAGPTRQEAQSAHQKLMADDTGLGSLAQRAGQYDFRRNPEFQTFFEVVGRELLRVAKPGAHLVAFGGPRTHHRLMAGLEDAGWEIRDCLMWLFGSGFPKGTDHTKVGREGWNTALKPAYEPIVLARKPLSGTVAQTVQQWGTGALNIDGCRVAGDISEMEGRSGISTPNQVWGPGIGHDSMWEPRALGRWPANVVLDEAAAALLDATVGETGGGFGQAGAAHGENPETPLFGSLRNRGNIFGYGDRGGPSRFFYTSKASRTEREAGLEQFAPQRRSDGRATDIENPRLRTNARRNDHPTVKPVDLMRWLVRLVTPPGGLVLDPFCGSGSTGMAALDEGMRFLGVDLDPHYAELATARIRYRHHYEADPVEATADAPQGRLF